MHQFPQNNFKAICQVGEFFRKLFLISIFSFWRTDTLKRPWTCSVWPCGSTELDQRAEALKQKLSVYSIEKLFYSFLITWEWIQPSRGCLGLGWNGTWQENNSSIHSEEVRPDDFKRPYQPEYDSRLQMLIW